MKLAIPGLQRRPVVGELRIDGVAALGPAVRRLLARLLLDDDEELARLTGVASPKGALPEVAVVLGPTDALPWLEEAIHLGRLPDEPALLLPTGVCPPLPGAVLLRALRAHAPRARPPLVLLPSTQHVISLAEARPLLREHLRKRMEARA
ncbi:bpX5 domain-containing protein [Paraliomyxa miuraensis]|uniref:bpX5 domain-containing protein n=1 Tax=Paraliomyxa miuraensis TaxID=376150 RepID=UPI00224DD2E6|nr:hypothetical protein [Paraliomyxa miuraensis]MCX4246146.1 hypothetical protein [Paraliomyxa miuraensis]